MLSQKIIEKLLDEVDEDIRDVMLAEDKATQADPNGEYYKGYQLFPDPTNTILGWQEMRDRKNAKSTDTTIS